MEVVIRLQKAGKKANKKYNYRVVVMSKPMARQARNMDILGYYDPAKKPASLSINHEKLDFWLKRGAKMSDTVKSLASKTRKK